MNRVQKYFFNALLLACVGIAIRAISVTFNAFVSAKIGAEGMGLLTLTSGVYGFAITVATSGINLAVVRLVSCALPYNDDGDEFSKSSERRIGKIMKNATVYCLSFSILASLCLFFGADAIGRHALGDVRAIPSLRLLSFTLVPISLSSMLSGYFSAVRRVYKSVIVQLTEQAVKISVVSFLLLVFGSYGLEYACCAVVAGGALSEASCVAVSSILYFFDRKIHRCKSKISDDVSIKRGFFGFSKQGESKVIKTGLFGVAFPLAVSAYMRSALLTVEHIAIPWGLKKSGVGASSALASYGTLHGMVFPLLLFPSAVLGAFSSMLIPELSSAYESGENSKIRSIATRVFSFSLLFSIAVSGIFICFSRELGMLIYSSSEAGEFIRIFSPLIPLMYLDNAVDAMLKGLGEQLYSMRINIIDSFISVILVVTLLPSFGINGYVCVVFVAELFNTSMSILKLLKKINVKVNLIKWVVKPVLSIVISTSFVRYILSSVVVNPIIEISVAAIAYIALVLLLGAVNREDLSLFKKIAPQGRAIKSN